MKKPGTLYDAKGDLISPASKISPAMNALIREEVTREVSSRLQRRFVAQIAAGVAAIVLTCFVNIGLWLVAPREIQSAVRDYLKEQQIEPLMGTIAAEVVDTEMRGFVAGQLVPLEARVTSVDRRIELAVQSILDAPAYARVANLTSYGQIESEWGRTEGPLTGWSLPFYLPQSPNLKCDDASLESLERIIEEYRVYPYPYEVMANCLYGRGDPAWRTYLAVALGHTEAIVRVPFHNREYDRLLQRFRDMQAAFDSGVFE